MSNVGLKDFDWEYYLDKNTDLRRNGVRTQAQALKHWTKYGRREKRVHRFIEQPNNKVIPSKVLKILYVGFSADIKTSSCNIYREGFRENGHQVDDFEYVDISKKIGETKMNQQLLEKAHSYDIIFIYKGEKISSNVLREIKTKYSTRIILFYHDQRFNLQGFILAMLPYVDLFVHTTGGNRLQQYHQQGRPSKSMYMFTPANTKVFEDFGLKRTTNVLFTARNYPFEGTLRIMIKKYLKERKDVEIYGEKNVILGQKYIKTINQAKIGINVNDFYLFSKYSSNRLTDYLSCGLFTLSVYSEGMEQIFTDKQDLVYFRNFEEFKELLDYYLEHDEERETIARNGMNKVRNLYNTKVLSQEILNCLLNDNHVPMYNWIELLKNEPCICNDDNFAVFITCNDRYIPYAIVSLKAFTKYNPRYDKYILGTKFSRESYFLASKYGVTLLEVDLSKDFINFDRRPYGNQYPIECFYHFYAYKILGNYSYLVHIEPDIYTNHPMDLDLKKIQYIGGSIGDRKIGKFLARDIEKIRQIDVDPNFNQDALNSGWTIYNTIGLDKIGFYEKIVDYYKKSWEVGAPRCGDDSLMVLYQIFNHKQFQLVDPIYHYISYDKQRDDYPNIYHYHAADAKWWLNKSTNNRMTKYFNEKFREFLYDNFDLSFIQEHCPQITIL